MLKEELGLEVITKEMVEGIDYLEMTRLFIENINDWKMWIFICSVLIEVRAELSYPPLAINLGVPSDRARRCYFREQVWWILPWKVINILTQVDFIGTRWNKKLTRKSSRCAAVQKSIEPTTDHQQIISLEPTLDQQSLSLEITTDQLSLSLKTTNCQVTLCLENTNVHCMSVYFVTGTSVQL